MFFVTTLLLAIFANLATPANAVVVEKILDATSQDLDYVVVEVNGDPRLVRRGEELVIVRGDNIKITQAALVSRNKSPAVVNLMGFQNPSENNPTEDRNVAIDTSKQLQSQFTLEKDHELYRIKTTTNAVAHGDVFLRVLPPRLAYAVIKINDDTHIMRENELVHVGAKDRFKIDNVVTNVEEGSDTVRFQIIATDQPDDFTASKLYQIQFVRKGQVFARIPLQVSSQ